jgi:zeta-carotene desaturase
LFPLLSIKDKSSLLKLLIKVKFLDSQSLSHLTIKEWLEKENQTQNSINLFWEVISVGALNTSITIASAKLFCEILKQIFWTGVDSYKIILPSNSLNKTFINPVESFLIRNNVKICKSEKCEKIFTLNNKVSEVKTNKRIIKDFDYYLAALPFYSLKSFEILDTNDLDISYSPILNVYLWLNNNPLSEQLYAVVNSPIHWIFNKGKFINITISNAVELVDKSKDEIEKIILVELEKFIPALSKEVLKIVIIKEKRATFVPENNILGKRLNSKTKFSNLFLAGDWTDTKLPSTIEGAIKSGRIAAEEIINDHFNRN